MTINNYIYIFFKFELEQSKLLVSFVPVRSEIPMDTTSIKHMYTIP